MISLCKYSRADYTDVPMYWWLMTKDYWQTVIVLYLHDYVVIIIIFPHGTCIVMVIVWISIKYSTDPQKTTIY